MNAFEAQIFTLNFSQFADFVPYLLLVLTFAFSIIGSGLKLRPRFFTLLSLLGFGLTLGVWSMLLMQSEQDLLFLHVSLVTRMVGMLLCVFALMTLWLFDMPERYKMRSEWLALLSLCVLGLSLLPASRDWISFFVFLELFSIPAYVLVAFDVERERSLESALKYLLSGAFLSTLLLLGMALIYLSRGTLSFLDLSASLSHGKLEIIGMILILSTVFFKLTLVPFHFWAPDVYQGAPTPVAAFLAAATKLAVFSATAIALQESGFANNPTLLRFALVAGFLSIICGSFLAYTQQSFRRMLAYSGTVNMGLLAPLLIMGGDFAPAFFFLFIYGATLIIGQSPLAALLPKIGKDAHDDLLDWQIPSIPTSTSKIEVGLLAICLFSLAGIPPFPGFFAKYWIFSILWQHDFRFYVAVGLLSTLLGVAYYIRLAGSFYFELKQSNAK